MSKIAKEDRYQKTFVVENHWLGGVCYGVVMNTETKEQHGRYMNLLVAQRRCDLLEELWHTDIQNPLSA